MGEATQATTKKPIVRKKAGYRRVMVTLTEAAGQVLDDMAAADMRQGGATEMLTVLVVRNFETLVNSTKPANPVLPMEYPEAPKAGVSITEVK